MPGCAQLLLGCLSVLAPCPASTLTGRRLARVPPAPDQKFFLEHAPFLSRAGVPKRPLSVVVVDI